MVSNLEGSVQKVEIRQRSSMNMHTALANCRGLHQTGGKVSASDFRLSDGISETLKSVWKPLSYHS